MISGEQTLFEATMRRDAVRAAFLIHLELALSVSRDFERNMRLVQRAARTSAEAIRNLSMSIHGLR